MESFRNSPVPGPGGPAPMLAVFWDDLSTAEHCSQINVNQFGDVFVDTTSSDVVIVEWSNLRTTWAGDPFSAQALLFNSGELTPDGDDEIMILYRDFNNTTSGIYLPDYDGLFHGQYATIGLESHTQVMGLQYTYNNDYPVQAHPLEDHSGLFITTRQPVTLFSADSLMGDIPFTVQFSALDETADSYGWDIGADGSVDYSAPVIEHTFTEYGHYSVNLEVNQNGQSLSDYRHYFIHTVQYGCTDPIALNFDSTAVIENGSCDYLYGCMDPNALNYNIEAVMDDGSCFYLEFQNIPNIYQEDQTGLGQSMDFDGQYVVVGAYRTDINGELDQGSALIYRRIHENWTLQAELFEEDGEMFDYFGYCTAMDNDRILVGVYRDDELGASSGSAILYERNPEGEWNEIVKLTASDGLASDNFGYSVDLQDSIAVVGARKADCPVDTNTGAVYIFELQADGNWLQTAKLIASNAERNDSFGQAVSISGNYLAVGANLVDTELGSNTGLAYIYHRLENGEWVEEAILSPEEISEHSHFGISVALHNTQLLVGAMYDNDGEMINAGTVTQFEFEDGTWNYVSRITGSPSLPADMFGSSLALSGQYASIGSSTRLYLYYLLQDNPFDNPTSFLTQNSSSMHIIGNELCAGNPVESTAVVYDLEPWVDWLISEQTTIGDVNQDLQVDVLDIVMLVTFIVDALTPTPTQFVLADLNEDSILDILDVVMMVDMILL